STFGGWQISGSNPGTCTSSTASNCNFTITGQTTVTATFNSSAASTATLNFNTTGTGGSINCFDVTAGKSCGFGSTGNYNANVGDIINLGASGVGFTGWASPVGYTPNPGSCGTSQSCIFSMPSGSVTATANFSSNAGGATTFNLTKSVSPS